MEYNWIHGKTTKFQKEVCLHRQNEKRPQNFYWHEARLRKSLKCKHGLFFFCNGQGGWLRGQSYWEKWNRKSHPKNWAILKKHSLSLDLTELICSQLDFSMAIKQWLLSTSHFPSFECPGLLPEILTQSSLSHHRVLEGEDAQRFYQSIERGLLRPLYWDLLRGLLRETKSLN